MNWLYIAWLFWAVFCVDAKVLHFCWWKLRIPQVRIMIESEWHWGPQGYTKGGSTFDGQVNWSYWILIIVSNHRHRNIGSSMRERHLWLKVFSRVAKEIDVQRERLTDPVLLVIDVRTWCVSRPSMIHQHADQSWLDGCWAISHRVKKCLFKGVSTPFTKHQYLSCHYHHLYANGAKWATKKPWLVKVYREWNPAQLYGDYNKPL